MEHSREGKCNEINYGMIYYLARSESLEIDNVPFDIAFDVINISRAIPLVGIVIEINRKRYAKIWKRKNTSSDPSTNIRIEIEPVLITYLITR